jgi:hypothetical protein
VIWWNRQHDSADDLQAFLDAKLTELSAGLSRNRQAMSWLRDRATDDSTLLAMVGTALVAIGQQEQSLAEIQRRLVREQPRTKLSE